MDDADVPKVRAECDFSHAPMPSAGRYTLRRGCQLALDPLREAVADQIAISALLREVSETRHVIFRITDGDGPDLASRHADWPDFYSRDLAETFG